jgi:hypothetical protein
MQNQDLGVELDQGPIEGSNQLIWRKISSLMVIRKESNK